MNITQSYLRHRGWHGGEEQDEGILAPFIIADSAYIIYEDYIKPLGLRQHYKQAMNKFMASYRAFNKEFFAAFNEEETDYILDKMDQLHTAISNDIELLRISVMNNLSQFPTEVKKNIANFTALLHLSQCANILFGELFKVKSIDDVAPMHNKHLRGMVSYAENLFTSYTRRYAHTFEVINLNEIKDIATTSKTLCNNILKQLNLWKIN